MHHSARRFFLQAGAVKGLNFKTFLFPENNRQAILTASRCDLPPPQLPVCCPFKLLVNCVQRAVSRSGLAVRRQAGKQRDLGSNPLRLSFLFKSCGLWTLSCDFVSLTINETLKWLSTLPILIKESFWW